MDGQIVDPQESVKAWERELAIFGGQTALIESRSSSSTRSSPSGGMSTTISNAPNNAYQDFGAPQITSTPAVGQSSHSAPMIYNLPVNMEDISLHSHDNGQLFSNEYLSGLNSGMAFNGSTVSNETNGYTEFNSLLDSTPNGMINDIPSLDYTPLSDSEIAEMLGVQFGQGHEMAQDWSSLVQRLTPSDMFQG